MVAIGVAVLFVVLAGGLVGGTSCALATLMNISCAVASPAFLSGW